MNKLIVKLLCLGVGLIISTGAIGQRINDPTHIPNRFQNKINNVRLKGLTQRSSSEDQVEEETGKHIDKSGFGFANDLKIIESNGCNINVGNSVNSGVGSSADRNVIIAGDVINVCK